MLTLESHFYSLRWNNIAELCDWSFVPLLIIFPRFGVFFIKNETNYAYWSNLFKFAGSTEKKPLTKSLKFPKKN